jgi:hypothetical protein
MVPALLIAGPPRRKSKGLLVSAIVVIAPPLVVKSPLPPSSRLAKKATVPASLIPVLPKLLKGPLLSAIKVVAPPLTVKRRSPSPGGEAVIAIVPSLLIVGFPRKGASCKLLSVMKVVAPPLLVKRPPPKKLLGTPVLRKAVKATVPSSLSAGGDWNVPNVPDGPLSSAIAIVVVAPPVPVKMPSPPVSRLVRKATVPPLLITGSGPLNTSTKLKGPLSSAILVKVKASAFPVISKLRKILAAVVADNRLIVIVAIVTPINYSFTVDAIEQKLVLSNFYLLLAVNP